MTRQSTTVLLIEDNPGDVGLVRALLAEVGDEFLLIATDRLAEGLDLLAKTGADVALLDLSLPDSEGLETFSRLKSRAPDVPVVVLSGLDDEVVATEAVKAGAQDYLTKGQISSGLLARSLRYAIERRRVEARLREETRTIETINRVGRALSSELDPRKLMQAVTDAATELTGARFGAFFNNEVNEQGEIYVLYTLAGASQDAFERFPTPRNNALFEPTFRGEGVVRLDDVSQDFRYGTNPPYFGMPKGHLPVRSYLATPVVSRSGEVLGGLFFGHPEPRVFNERAERILEGIAAQAAIAIDNARLYQRARDAIRLRDEFLSIASHELRTPITSMRVHAQALLRRFDREGSLPPEQVIRGLRTIEGQTGRLAHLITQLLDVSRLESGKLPLNRAPADLVQLVERIVTDMQAWAHRHPIALRALGPVPARVDAVRIEQVLTNLLVNAVKYSPEGSPIEVELHRTSKGWVELAVRDHGVGIPEEKRGRLFERFFQAHPNAHAGGLGLGLYISRQIVELHNGQLAPEFPEDGGCRFVVQLPTDTQ